VSRSQTSAFIAIGAATLLWGMNYSFAKIAVTEIHPLAVAFVRVLAATPLFFAVLARRGEPVRPTASEIRVLLPLGLSGVFANQLFFIFGIRRTTPAHSSLVVALLPITVLLLAAWLLKEPITRLKAGGVALAFGGILLLSFRNGWRFSRDTLAGDVLTFCGVCSFSYYTVAGKATLPRFGVLRTTALAFLTGGAAVALVAAPAAARQDWGTVSSRGWISLAYVVLVGTFLCYYLFFWALSRIESGKVAAFTYFQPVIATITSFLLLGETIEGHFVLAGLAVLTGVWMTERG
jgi:drug/metabolite transporter (DMT)-like permease